MKKPEIGPDIWRMILDHAMGAYGAALALGETHPVCQALDKASQFVETAFCRSNRGAYREWAADQAVLLRQRVDPCDAWYEGNLKKSEYRWIDEP